MAAVTGTRDDRRASPLGVGVVVWLASELMFFAGLFAAYFTLRSAAKEWPPDGVELATARTAIATAVLVASSFTMHAAVKAASARTASGRSRGWGRPRCSAHSS